MVSLKSFSFSAFVVAAAVVEISVISMVLLSP
jgi:hypothetical protein